MQDEMISEIEADAPEFIVFTDSTMSWGSKPGPNTKILEWWKSYQTNYTLAALTSMIAPSEIAGAGSSETPARQKTFPVDALKTYRRKNTAPPPR